VDLIARRGRVVAFIEVKTRRGTEFGSPGSAVGRRKQAVIGKVADIWRIRFGHAGDEYRFDVVEVSEGGATPEINHIEDAWRGLR
jgi:putative endonuclease